jgi:RNA recognition motif. (a.k.a. RRM, RBD, or RNP domain)
MFYWKKIPYCNRMLITCASTMASEISTDSSRKRKLDLSSKSTVENDVVVDRKDDDKLTEKEKRRAERDKRRQIKFDVLANVPKVDENGISYTKQQVRRMRKRMEKGLNPIESSAERHERLRYEAQLRKEEELEYLGQSKESATQLKNAYDQDNEDANSDKDTDVDTFYDKDGDKDDIDGAVEDDNDNKKDNSSFATSETNTMGSAQKPVVKKPRHETKKVPNDYICAACQNKHQPNHWIYDCPSKVTKRKGVFEPNARKVFASGFPFSFKQKDIISLFESKIPKSKVIHCKMLLFQDTKRGKGQAFVTFDTEENAKSAIKLKGVFFDTECDGKSITKMQDNGATKKKLELRVIKCINRIDSKKKFK